VVVAALRKFVIGDRREPDLRHRDPIIPRFARVVRAASLSIARCPTSTRRALLLLQQPHYFRHMAPNVVAPYLIMFTAFIAQAILLEASLSFLASASPSRPPPGA